MAGCCLCAVGCFVTRDVFYVAWIGGAASQTIMATKASVIQQKMVNRDAVAHAIEG